MLEWSAEQTKEISTEFIDREFLPIMTNQERGVQNLEFILEQMHTVLTDLTSGEANDIVANSRKNPLGGVATTAEEIPSYNRREEEKPSSHYRFSGTMPLFWNSKREFNAGSLLCRSTRKCWRIR